MTDKYAKLREVAEKDGKQDLEFARINIMIGGLNQSAYAYAQHGVDGDYVPYEDAKRLLAAEKARADAAEAERDEARRALVLIAHTCTEDSHGNVKDYPVSYYKDIARSALTNANAAESRTPETKP